MTDARCEPTPELRGKDGWHWLESDNHGPVICRWTEHRGVKDDWRWHYHGNRDIDISQAAIEVCGWRYLSPVLTPAEVAALRAERDAAVAENHKLKTGNKLLADTVRSWGWESRKQESNGELVGRALWEQYGALAALCAEVEKLRAALKPFADAAPKFRDCGDVIEVADIAHDATFTVGDLRRAATLANAVEVGGMSATCGNCKWWESSEARTPRTRKNTVGRCLFPITRPEFPVVVTQSLWFRWPPSKNAAWSDQGECPTHQPKETRDEAV